MHDTLAIGRFYLPAKPMLTEANLGGADYAELGGRFKAAHVKLLIWWVTRKSQEVPFFGFHTRNQCK